MATKCCAALLIPLAALVPVCSGQSDDVGNNKLILQIHWEDLLNGVPQSISFVILNEGDKDIHLPNPEIRCQGRAYDGQILLTISFLPNNPQDGSFGNGCSEENQRPPAIQERLKGWITLHPGKSLTLNASKQDLGYMDSIAGKFIFTAVYYPPVLNPTDPTTLKDLGIDYPQSKLTSDPIQYSKRLVLAVAL